MFHMDKKVHERDKDMDFLFIIIRMLLAKDATNVKIILMSATIDSNMVRDYTMKASSNRIDIILLSFFSLQSILNSTEMVIGCQLQLYELTREINSSLRNFIWTISKMRQKCDSRQA